MLTIYYILEYTKSEGVEDMRKFVICLVMLLLVASPASACIGARYAALGWSGVAIADDATASYWNPAALVWAKDGLLWENIRNRKVIAIKEDNIGFHFVGTSGQTYWRVSYGHQLASNSALGINVGWNDFYNSISDYNGPSVDVSYTLRSGNMIFAILGQNIGNIRPSIAYQDDYITITADAYDVLELCPLRHYRAGIELVPISFLSLRWGYESLYDEYAYGIGFEASFASVDIVVYEGNYGCSFTLF